MDLFLVFNDAEMMASKAQEAQELLEGDVSCLVYRHNEFTFGLPHFLYEYYREPGKLKDFLNTIVNNFPPPVIDGCGTGCGFVALSEYALEQGDLETAELNAYKAIYKARTKDQYPIMLCAQFTLMRLKAAQGRFADAVEMLRVMKEIVAQWGEQAKLYQVNYAIYNMTLDLSEGYLYGCLEMPEMIPEWLRTGEMDPKDFMLQGMGFPCIVYGKAVLLSGNWAELEILCEAFEEKYALFHNQLGLLHNAIYRAVARMKLYGIEAGLAALLPALIEAQMDGILLPFAENAGYLLPMLEKLWGTSELDSLYLEKLTALCRQYSENLKNVRPSPSILTQRETQVLALLAQGLTQRQIASRLYLSVSGVKRHLENIYCKLGVNNKISAVQKAREAKIV